MVADSDFTAKAAGCPLWQLRHGDLETRVELAATAHRRFPHNSFMLVAAGRDRLTRESTRLVVEAGLPYIERLDTGERTPVSADEVAPDWDIKGRQGITSRSGWENPPGTEAEIERRLGPAPSAEGLLESGVYDGVLALRRELGDEVYLGLVAHGIFPAAIDIMGGFEDGMLTLREKPGLFQALLEQLARRKAAVVEAGKHLGVDAAWLGGYLEGADLISPDLWRELVMPAHRLQVEAAHEAGLQALFWFLGDAMPLLHDLADLGIDALVLEQPRRGYSSDPIEVRREIGDAFCVYGWNWELDFIDDNRERITQEVERQIRGAGRDGGFIMGTTYLTAEARLDTIDFYCDEVIRVSREVG
jgi:uroporphyrinogen-III decarboxylase